MTDWTDLARRYDVRAPRYTSYPTAADFHDGVDASTLRNAVERTNADPLPAPVALYLHVPFCRSLCYYCACNKVVTRNEERAGRYAELIGIEAARLAPWLAADRTVTQIHLGGGTPTYLSPGAIGGLIDSLDGAFPLARGEDSEWSIEIDPRTVSPEDIHALRAIGFSRVSFGVQDLDPRVQEAINRRLEPSTLGALVEAARHSGMRSVNFDLIYGLPHQSPERFAGTLDAVTDMGPDRIAMYGYAHLPRRFRAQRLLEGDALPAPRDRLLLLHGAITAFEAAGYDYIGMDHFARPDDALARSRRDGTLIRNFQGYVPGPDTDLLGLGASAISSLGNAYLQNVRGVRDWETTVAGGRHAVERGYVLDADDRLRRALISAVMCRDTVVFADFENHFDVDFHERFGTALDRLDGAEKDGLVKRFADRLEITARGRRFLRAIAMVFDARLHGPDTSGGALYSRAV